MLLVLSNGRFPLYHLHFHSSRHEKLGAILAVSTFLLLLLLEDGIVLRSIVAMALVVVLLVVSYTLGGGRYVTTSRLVAASASTSSSDLCRVLVVSVELMDVQGVATLVHVGLVLTSLSVVAINLNSLGAVALLSVKLASLLMTNVDRLDKEGLVVASSSVRRMSRHASSLLANHRLTGRVEAEVGLSHQLLVEGCVDTSISVEVASLMHLLLSRTSISSLTASASSFE